MNMLIHTRDYSGNPVAVYSRNRRLTNEVANDAHIVSNRKTKNKAKARKVLLHATGQDVQNNKNRQKYLTTRIAHHLSRGRSIADIVIRENAPVSLVQQLVKAMEVVK